MPAIIVPELLVKKCFVSTNIYDEYQKFKRTTFSIDNDTIVISSSLSGVDSSFALALLHCLVVEKTFNQLLCVYNTEDECSRWMKVARSMSPSIRVHHLCAQEQVCTFDNDDYFNVVFIERPLLWVYFRHTSTLRNTIPFVDDDHEVVFPRLAEANVIAPDVRCVNSTPFPLDYEHTEFSVYKFFWHALIYPSSSLNDFVYDLNMLSTSYGPRICLLTNERYDAGDKIVSLAHYRQLVSTFSTPIDEVTNYVIRSSDESMTVAEADLLYVSKYHVLAEPLDFILFDDAIDNDEDDSSTITTLRRIPKRRPSSDSFSSSSSTAQQQPQNPSALSLLLLKTRLMPFNNLREIIDFNSSRKIHRKSINSESNYSMMLIYDQEMIDRLRPFARVLGSTWRHSSRYLKELTDSSNIRTKCALIETFIMSQLDKQFYLLSPFISPSHPLCNFPNVRNLHPTDIRPAHALPEDATLLVFDAMFANNFDLDFSSCRCHVIFVVYQHTHEEEELQKFLVGAPESNDALNTPAAYYMPYTSPLPIRKYREEKIHMESIYKMAIVHFRTDNRSSLYVNLHPLLSRLLDITLAEVGKRFCRRSAIYTKTKYTDIPNLHRQLYAHRCASIPIIRFFTAEEEDELLGNFCTPEEEEEINNEQRLLAQELSDCHAVLAEERRKQHATTVDYLLQEDADGEDAFELHMTFNPHSLAYRNSICLPPKIQAPSEIKDLTCLDCNVVMSTYRALLQHMQSSAHKERIQQQGGSSEGDYSCGTCDQNFTTHAQLLIHNETHAHKKRLKTFDMKTCSKCNKTMNVRNYEHHLSTAHEVVNPEASFYGHRQTHCIFCDFSTSMPGSVMDNHNESPLHMIRVTPSERAFEPFSLHLNRQYLVFAAIHELISPSAFSDPCCYNILLKSRNADLTTLCLITACIRPTNRRFYRSLDNSCGFVSCSLTKITGIIGHFVTCELHTNRPCSCSFADEDHPLIELLIDFIKNEEREGGSVTIDYLPKNLLPYLQKACDRRNKEITCIEDVEINFLPKHDRSYISLLIKGKVGEERRHSLPILVVADD